MKTLEEIESQLSRPSINLHPQPTHKNQHQINNHQNGSSSSTTATTATLKKEGEGSHEFDSVESVIEAIKRGEIVVIVDDEDRENEGDLMIPASEITTESMAFIIKHTSGFVCVGVDGSILDRLKIPLMVEDEKNKDSFRTAFAQTIDYRFHTTTGISAHDRALTALKLCDPNSSSDDFNRPGHLVPLRPKKGGVLIRRGHTEAGVDLCELAGLPKVSIICELVKPDCKRGEMSNREDCFEFSKMFKLRIVSIEMIVEYIKSIKK